MKDGPCLEQFHKRSGKEFKKLAAYLYGIFKKNFPKPYLTKYRNTWYFHTLRYPRIWKTVPRLRNGLK